MAKRAYNPVWFILLMAIAMAVIVSLPSLGGGEEKVPWRTDYSTAQTEARGAGKPMLVYFTADWCGPCQTMKRTTWADDDVVQALSAYVPVKVNIDQNPNLAIRYGVESIPMMVLADADGTPHLSTTGAMPSSDFLVWLKDATPNTTLARPH